jgi:hypothetical protein
MSLNNHLESLKQKHLKLDSMLKQASLKFDNDYEVMQIKKQKLLLKEKIHHLEAESPQ